MDEAEVIAFENKVIVGLTGNIATGKSAVMRLAGMHDALTLDADKIVHEIMNTDTEMQAALAVAFGSEVRRANGRIDRRALGKIVFNDPEALKDLERMIHPEVHRCIAEQIQASDADVVFVEAIKLLDGKLRDLCHQIWVTRCSPQRQLERLRVCRGMDTQEAAARIKQQGPQAEKVALADTVIDTEGYMRDTEVQFEMAWRRLPDPASAETKTLSLRPRSGLQKQTDSAANGTAAPSGKTAPPLTQVDVPENVLVRRAKPSDIPGILLLIQRATDGAVKMKRGDLLLALSERGYLIGQEETTISTVMGFSIDSQVARIDAVYIYPEAQVTVTGTAVLAEVEQSAFHHMCEIILVFLPTNAPGWMQQIFTTAQYETAVPGTLARNWQEAIAESQPENTTCLFKILRDTRLSNA